MEPLPDLKTTTDPPRRPLRLPRLIPASNGYHHSSSPPATGRCCATVLALH
uniref:Uncharacterized protein n=1 Tax=Arundo donax TaxID=35708 RepID=A0A0A9A9G9_ARUDO